MGRNRSTFTEADVKRAINAVRRAGLEIAAVEIDRDGKISIQLGRPNALHEPNKWDDSPERLRELIGGPQPSRNLSLRRQPSRAEGATTENLDWYDTVY